MENILALYPPSYEASRRRFRENLDRLKVFWPAASLFSHRLPGDEDLTIDRIEAPALTANERVLVFTTGEHGIEGFVGSAMLQRFLDTILPQLDPATTGLILVHAINPWGMAHRRRTNAANVDLNRNFVLNPSELDPSFNPEFARLDACLTPAGEIHSLADSERNFSNQFSALVEELGRDAFWSAARLGQYFQPKGIHYGGDSLQAETSHLLQIYESALRDYAQILHLDIHTGYGPRYQMSLVNSVYEPRSSADLAARFDYPIVVAANPDEFYAILGDMVDCLYRLWERKYPHRRLYATAFEFGTFGETLEGQIRTLQTMILENQAYWYGCSHAELENQVKTDFCELFAPSDAHWRVKAVEDADRAFAGILQANGFVKNK